MKWTNPPDSYPSNAVLPFMGPLSSVPEGWVVCDGGAGTPDLRGKYVRGVASANSLPGSTGGQNSYNISTSQMASHSHNGKTGSAGSHRHSIRTREYYYTWCCSNSNATYGSNNGATDYGGSHSHGDVNVGNSGGNSSVDNHPAYIETLYIQKL